MYEHVISQYHMIYYNMCLFLVDHVNIACMFFLTYDVPFNCNEVQVYSCGPKYVERFGSGPGIEKERPERARPSALTNAMLRCKALRSEPGQLGFGLLLLFWNGPWGSFQNYF